MTPTAKPNTPDGLPADLKCAACGCTYTHACILRRPHQARDDAPTTCSWIRLDRDKNTGLCSTCGEHVDAWDRGARTLEQLELLG